ncbi:MAG: Mammalian cell entry related domain protein [Aeromicrobium sp.]|jgi:phospholipid/cholesterol/gamma-HCH transport system substrate-binding protein|uniref:MlaD family protein n=1 Tax=Aeromicrobium sp. TaxID=1871063 RepID=UPI00262964C3|nr:MlaD family protein [Aeromicrobium sp.]MCW2789620.1 Mammalian cell entry related domain protein [Aeromicrobium sp.]MCW2824989.1 Mammalian cell entry related domain protein [Aeromicrobium sp.]
MSSNRARVRSLSDASPKAVGLAVLIGLLAFALFAFNRPRVETMVSRGEGLEAVFSASYKLVPYQSVVKLAGVEVGTVTGVERSDGDRAVVSMKLSPGTRDKLGSEPAANVRPTLVLGGTYYVELVRGGKDGDIDSAMIPVARTSVPVELDKVLSTVTPSASEAAQRTVKNLDKALDGETRGDVRKLLDDAPDTLDPASDVLRAVRGTHPDTDLTGLVAGARNVSRALSSEDGQLGSILDHLATTSATLAGTRGSLSRAVADGPRTLDVAQSGLADLDATLTKLDTTATAFRPSARALDGLLGDLRPALRNARPVIADARVVAHDAEPLVQTLVPTTKKATGALQDIKGPVIDRLDGPIKKAVLSPWHGKGVYDGGGNDHPLYKEVGYLLSDTADAFKYHDHNGAMGRLMAGVGVNSPGGIVNMSVYQYLEKLGLALPKGPEEGANDKEAAPPLGSAPSSASDAEKLGSSPLFHLLPGLLSPRAAG